MKKTLPNVYVLTLICLVTALLLAVVNSFTLPVIKAAEERAVQAALREVHAKGGNFTKLDLSGVDLSGVSTEISEVYEASEGGYVIKVVSAGYSTGLQIIVGIDKDGKVAGAKCLASGETLGYEKSYGESLLGADRDTISGIATVSGATKTTTGYKKAVQDALTVAAALSGN
jgi:electron transport complex protein RnfG